MGVPFLSFKPSGNAEESEKCVQSLVGALSCALHKGLISWETAPHPTLSLNAHFLQAREQGPCPPLSRVSPPTTHFISVLGPLLSAASLQAIKGQASRPGSKLPSLSCSLSELACALSVECFSLNKPTSCLSLNSFCDETSRT